MSEQVPEERHYSGTAASEQPKPLHTIYVKNINASTRAKDLGELFEKFGKLIRCDVPEPKPGQAPYAFVEFESTDDAQKAMTELQAYEMDENKIELEWARRRTGYTSRGRGFGLRGGRGGRMPFRGGYSRGGFRGGRGAPYGRGGYDRGYDDRGYDRPPRRDYDEPRTF